MATKKVPSIEDAVKEFKDVMQRCALTDYFYVNRGLISKSDKGYYVMLIPDEPLLDKIMEDPDLKPHIQETNPANPEHRAMEEAFQYATDINGDGWLPMDLEKLYAGEVLRFTIDGWSYDLMFNKDLLPLKLRKAEYVDIYYKIYTGKEYLFGVKKRFETKKVENGGFYMLKFFRII